MDGPLNASVHLLEDAPAPTSHEAYWWGTRNHWSWSSIMKPPPFRVTGMQSSAVHPGDGGRTLFVCVGKNHVPYIDMNDDSIGASHIFSYDRGTGEWMRHGEWDMPFLGRAHYDIGLDAWVGLHKIFHHPQQLTDGYLSSCDVASLDGCPAQLAWNLCTERLFDPDDDWHIGASLVYMGDNIYCLVELVAHERFKKRRRLCVGHKCAVRLTIFRLRYGKNGELTITARRPDHTYLFPRFGNNTGVRAFWM
ncbi:hypothetical protein VPH35_016943 [Triticum aestivum]